MGEPKAETAGSVGAGTGVNGRADEGFEQVADGPGVHGPNGEGTMIRSTSDLRMTPADGYPGFTGVEHE
jgi:hypothetical protein